MTETTTTPTPVTRTRPVLPGQVSLFRGKVRMPISVTLTPEHRDKAGKAAKRLGLSRADLIGLLIEKYADTVKL
jgi:hypothetical protein